ncbi:MAG TPA: hypothetical protein PL048_24755, partial [Leptospiraceae bacterium]|nr:hypothetical protein [Leptospiraceae bacterium]
MILFLFLIKAVSASDEPEKKRYISLFLNQASFEYKPFQSHSFGVNIYSADAAIAYRNFTSYSLVYSSVYPFTNTLPKETSIHQNLFYKYFPLGNRNFFLSFHMGMAGRGTYRIAEQLGFSSSGAFSVSPYEITLVYKPVPFLGLTGG